MHAPGSGTLREPSTGGDFSPAGPHSLGTRAPTCSAVRALLCSRPTQVRASWPSTGQHSHLSCHPLLTHPCHVFKMQTPDSCRLEHEARAPAFGPKCCRQTQPQFITQGFLRRRRGGGGQNNFTESPHQGQNLFWHHRERISPMWPSCTIYLLFNTCQCRAVSSWSRARPVGGALRSIFSGLRTCQTP